MSIISMQRLALIGLDTKKETLISQLMDFGAVELTTQNDKFDEEIWRTTTVQDENQEDVALLEGKLSRTETALEVLEQHDARKGPLFKTRRLISKARVEDAARHMDEAEANVQIVLALNDKLHKTTEQLNKLETDQTSLSPWTNYDLPLEIHETGTCAIHMGIIPLTAELNEMQQQLEKQGTSCFRLVSGDKDMHYVAILSLKQEEEAALTVLKQHGFTETVFRDLTGTVAENLQRLAKEKEALQQTYQEIEAEIAAHADLREPLEEYFDLLQIAVDKEKVKAKLLKTRRTFFLEGWIPTRYVEKAKTILEENGCYYQFRDPEEGEVVPVALQNANFFVPFEEITEMYSLPDYRGFDPTSIFALFYAVFFGMMLSDAGYGILMAVACFIVLKKFALEGTTYKMIKLFFYCGISTTFWGAMFGGWFGDIVAVVSRTFLGHEVALEPLWFNPIEDPMKLLIFSLALGVIHIFIGMGIQAYMQIRQGKWFDAICDEGFWYLTILGLISWLGGGMVAAALVSVGKWMAIVGIAGLLLTGGRHNRGIGKITGGLSSVYNITSYLSDILSYARILALGLATGVIAQVVNTMGAMFGGGIGGAIALLFFVVGHALNLVINALGSFIHASRLQYIEFFGKFYEDGGEPFDPFRKKTRYIRISQDEQ